MKCPKCKQKMIFDRDLRDYYCEKCKKSLTTLESKEVDDTEEIDEVDEKDVKLTGDSKQGSPPEVGTLKGLIFMMFGSIFLIVGPLVCQVLSMMGIALIILGFYMVYQDRNKHSRQHINSVRFAFILIIIWIIIYIFTIIFSYYISYNLDNELSDYKNDDIIPESILISYHESLISLAISIPLVVGIMGIAKYLTIKNLIIPKLKNVLTVIVSLLVLSGFLSMYVSIDLSQRYMDNVGDTTKEDFRVNEINYTIELSQNTYLLYYGVIFLNTTFEGILILCFYWTYKYQRTLPKNLIL